MTANPAAEVRIWSVSRYKGKRKTTHSVRWIVTGRPFQRTFATNKLAETFRATLLVAARDGRSFNSVSGLPIDLPAASARTWVEHAAAFIDVKWPHASPRHRKGLAEGLITATLATLPAGSPEEDARRRWALSHWVFNTSARTSTPLADSTPPEDIVDVVREMRKKSPTLQEVSRPGLLREVLEALALRLDGTPAAPSTATRKRSAFYSALAFAVEIGELPANPMDRITRKRPVHAQEVDRRVVVNPSQAAALLEAVDRLYPSLAAFFACIYYAGLRPSEVRHLRVADLDLPDSPSAWGSLNLTGSTQTAGARWTDSGSSTEDRELKHRPRRATRIAPAPPELVTMLRKHLSAFAPGVGGRLFVTRAGRAGVPVAPPFASAQSMGVVYRIWDLARRDALTSSEYESTLAKRPYDLRHAAVSLWLNAGVPATQVAEWAGHSVNILLRVYASCIVGQDEAARMRVEAALQPTRPPGPAGAAPASSTSARFPRGQP